MTERGMHIYSYIHCTHVSLLSLVVIHSPGCTKDYLRVWENLDQSDDYLEFCGRNFPYRYTLENTAYIYYHTDSYNTQSYSTRVRGFSVTYSSTG